MLTRLQTKTRKSLSKIFIEASFSSRRVYSEVVRYERLNNDMGESDSQSRRLEPSETHNSSLLPDPAAWLRRKVFQPCERGRRVVSSHNLTPNVLMMQATKNRHCHGAPDDS